MDEEDIADCLEVCAWKISDVLARVSRCPHVSQRRATKIDNQLCGPCAGIQTQLGLVSIQLDSRPDACYCSETQHDAHDLLRILEEMCSWPQTPRSGKPSQDIQSFDNLRDRVQDENNDKALQKSIIAYLREPYTLKGLTLRCEKLLNKLQVNDREEGKPILEPEDHSTAQKKLFLALRKYTECHSCIVYKTTRPTPFWHTTRLALMDPPKSNGDMVQFDVIASSTGDESWRDVCINISKSASQRVAFAVSDDESLESMDKFDATNQDQIDKFCEIFEDDYGCRISLQLEDGILFRLGVDALKHRASNGKGVSLKQVLDEYNLTVREKLALSHAIALAFWQFYNSRLMYQAWSSSNIWFMPELDLRNNSERLPLRIYISFNPEATKCEIDASEYIDSTSLVHRCPRIQSLAILLVEIGLGESFLCQTPDNHTRRLNYRYSMASQYLENLKAATWENFTHKFAFCDVVEECLKVNLLMGKGNTEYCDSHMMRRDLLHQRVVAPLESLHKSFRGVSDQMSYLSVKRPKDKPPPKHTLEFSPIRTNLKRKRPVAASRQEFEIAIICALTLEANAMVALFDEIWDDDDDEPGFDGTAGDPNAYSTGCIGLHNVVLAYMPSMGKGNASSVAANCRRSFPNIRLAIVVGVCGAVPFVPGNDDEVVLGDVIMSDGIVQYDFGRQLPGGFERKDSPMDSLGGPNMEISALLAKLKTLRNQKAVRLKMAEYLGKLQKESDLKAEYPGIEKDILFDASYQYLSAEMTCQKGGCNGKLVSHLRLNRGMPQPAVHFGLIASGDKIMKSGEERDNISKQERIIAFEMEGAGVCKTFPCVVIKGACDYADSHKTKIWQFYAAATAAACTKAVLGYWAPLENKAKYRN